MANPADDLQPPLDAAAMGAERETNLNLKKTPRRFTPPQKAPEASREGGASGSGFGAFKSPEPTPLEVPDWLQQKQDGNVPAITADDIQEEGGAAAAIRMVKAAMIAPLQAQIDAIEANAGVIIPILTDLKQLQGLIATTDDKNEMIDAVKVLIEKTSGRMNA